MDNFEEWLSLLGPNPYVHAAVAVVVSIVLAKMCDWMICGLVGRWARRTETDLDDRLIQVMHRPVFVTVVVVGLATATRLMPIPEFPAWVTMAALKTVVIVVWLVFGVRFTGLVLAFLSSRAQSSSFVQAQTVPLLENVAMVALVGAAVYFLFLSWNIDVTAWLASAGIIGLALSFAAKDTLANLFAGVFILVDAPYKIGDYIVLDTGERGCVTHIGLRSTRLLTRDDIEVTIPNSVMGNAKIVNESGGPWQKERLRIAVGVAYGSDVDRVRAILHEIASRHAEICDDPAPRVRFRRFGESGLDFELLCWIEEPVLRGKLQDALNTEIYKEFARQRVEIPFPKRDVYVRHMAAPVPGAPEREH